MQIKIFVACHNQLPKYNGSLLEFIQVGKQTNQLDLKVLSDASGDNISALNYCFCELTGIYWVWKNDCAYDYIGLYHYRRVLAKPSWLDNLVAKWWKLKFWVNGFSFKFFYHFVKHNSLLQYQEFINLKLDNYDLIVPTKYYLASSVWDDYAKVHEVTDLEDLRIIIYQEYEDYIPAFDLVFARNYFYPFNLFIMRREYFCQYCTWLFSILLRLHSQLDLSTRNSYQLRVFGFISERLFNVFVTKLLADNPQLKIKELLVCKFS